MTIWYDVTGLAGWNKPYLTGIQRTTVGILQGLLSHDGDVRLVSFDARRRCFVPAGPDSLPPVARELLATTGFAADIAEPAGERERRTMRLRRAIFGGRPAAEDLRAAWRTWRWASRDLVGCSRRWLRSRFSKKKPSSLPAPWYTGAAAGSTVPRPQAPPVRGPFAPRDTLLSMGCTWATAGHAEAAAAERAHGVRVVRMIYDLIPTLKPQWVSPVFCRQFTDWARNILECSDHVLTISEFSKQEILRYSAECGFEPAPIAVVRLGDVIDAVHTAETPPLPRFVPSRPFFVCVSTLDVRKNHRLLYDAWSRMAAADPDACPDLVCIGTQHLLVDDLLHEIRHDRLVNGRIHLLDDVADSELAWYYAACRATIYPSRYEGWGLPVAESLGHGKLCLASNATSIPEIDGELPVFFDPLDPHELAGLVWKTLDDPDWVRDREQAIRDSFRPTPWSQTAGQLLAALRPSSAAVRRAA